LENGDGNGSNLVCGTHSDHQPLVAPNLDVLAIYHALGFLDCLGIAATNQRLEAALLPGQTALFTYERVVSVDLAGEPHPAMREEFQSVGFDFTLRQLH
jgi:hypothetical protein